MILREDDDSITQPSSSMMRMVGCRVMVMMDEEQVMVTIDH